MVPLAFLFLHRAPRCGCTTDYLLFARLRERDSAVRRSARPDWRRSGCGGLALLTTEPVRGWPGRDDVAADRQQAQLFGLTAVTKEAVPGIVLQWASGGVFWDDIGPENPRPSALE
jgi:hypothetical protein